MKQSNQKLRVSSVLGCESFNPEVNVSFVLTDDKFYLCSVSITAEEKEEKVASSDDSKKEATPNP